MPDNVLAKQIGKRIRNARNATKPRLTQEEVGHALGIGRAGYSNIENGRVLITVEHLRKLPEILGKPIPWYLGFDDVNNQVDDIIRVYAENSSVLADQSLLDGMRELVKKFIQLSPSSREAVLDYLRERYGKDLDKGIKTMTDEEKQRILDRLNKQEHEEWS